MSTPTSPPTPERVLQRLEWQVIRRLDGLLGGDRWFGGNWGSGGQFRRGINEVTLKRIADMTGGTYYSATSAGELQSVFQNLPSFLRTRQETTEISVAFTAIGALLAALAILLSLVWHPLP